ncbi:MAG: RAMP superfamily CRISPR-associated protein [Candidatus Bathyarchaeota archaeon]|nr:RAMP superfamily CRISPR-associated protein [Candidatus Bathyarchaeota archaeon]
MSHDFYAKFWDSIHSDVIDDSVKSAIAKADLMGLFLAKNKNYAKEKLQELIKTGKIPGELKNNLEELSKLAMNEPILEPSKLPENSHIIKIKFTLRKPYTSHDDKAFYVIDNPITKDQVFKIPLVRSSSWKGSLRWVSKYALRKTEPVVERLFGNQKEKQKAKQGRLFFYSTFLNQVSLDVITPLKRDTRTPRRGPILFEIVPAGAQGTFSLLYFPFDLLPALRSTDSSVKAKAIEEMKEDLEVLKEAIPAMLLTYGFAAKKTSGYSVVEDKIEFSIDSDEKKGHCFSEFKEQMAFLIKKRGEIDDKQSIS